MVKRQIGPIGKGGLMSPAALCATTGLIVSFRLNANGDAEGMDLQYTFVEAQEADFRTVRGECTFCATRLLPEAICTFDDILGGTWQEITPATRTQVLDHFLVTGAAVESMAAIESAIVTDPRLPATKGLKIVKDPPGMTLTLLGGGRQSGAPWDVRRVSAKWIQLLREHLSEEDASHYSSSILACANNLAKDLGAQFDVHNLIKESMRILRDPIRPWVPMETVVKPLIDNLNSQEVERQQPTRRMSEFLTHVYGKKGADNASLPKIEIGASG